MEVGRRCLTVGFLIAGGPLELSHFAAQHSAQAGSPCQLIVCCVTLFAGEDYGDSARLSRLTNEVGMTSVVVKHIRM